MADTFYCEKCNKTMNTDNFYQSNNTQKYPLGGKMNICKKCLTMHVDNWNPETYLWILQEIDVPYVPDEWMSLLEKYGKDRSKVTGVTILGRYLSKMKLKQYKDYRWKDNDFLQELKNAKIKQAMINQGYDSNEIALATARATIDIPADALPPPIPQEEVMEAESVVYADPWGPAPQDDYIDELSDEDRTFLQLKWGKTYRPEEWVKLEQLWQDMLNSYDIQSAGDLDTLKLVCKTSLKANQLLDIGDIDGAQKATKMYENLMKSGKWTAAQNKTEENEIVDSIGELVALCEEDGFIPKFYTSEPKDYADRVIEDLKKYTHDLIMNESGLSSMMETAIKQIAEEADRIKEAAETSEEDSIDKMFNYEDETLLDTDDYQDFSDFIEDIEETDNEFLKALEGDL